MRGPSSSSTCSSAALTAVAPKMELPDPLEWPSSDSQVENGYLPTPGGPLTPDRIGSLGVIKMNAYLVTGTRQQFWEEYFVKVIMQVLLLLFTALVIALHVD